MKVLKIHTPILTNFGVDIPAGAIIVVDEFLTQRLGKRDGTLTGQIVVATFASEDTLIAGKGPVLGIESYPPVLKEVPITEAEWEEQPAGVLSLTLIQTAFEKVFPSKTEIIDVKVPEQK